MLRVLIPRERRPGERRIAATPETVKRLIKNGLGVTVEATAGDSAGLSDSAFADAGAEVSADVAALWREADIVLKVAPPAENPVLEHQEAAVLKPHALLVGLLSPHRNLEIVRTLAQRRVSALAMELIPRVTRAQPMDALSSQASIAGYKAVLLAADRLDKYFPLLMTAAGTTRPARVVVMGAGVAGLQAVATARRLGAVVEVSDIRPEVEEQVASLGGRFIELPMKESGSGAGGYAREMGEEFLRRQREIVTRHVQAADVVITTALVPGRPAPRLITTEMVGGMRSGAVVIDLAVTEGGNCELSQADETVVHRGVQILAPSNLPSAMPLDASNLYARNVMALLQPLLHEGEVRLDLEDEIVAGALLTHEGLVRHAPTAELLAAPAGSGTEHSS